MDVAVIQRRVRAAVVGLVVRADAADRDRARIHQQTERDIVELIVAADGIDSADGPGDDIAVAVAEHIKDEVGIRRKLQHRVRAAQTVDQIDRGFPQFLAVGERRSGASGARSHQDAEIGIAAAADGVGTRRGVIALDGLHRGEVQIAQIGIGRAQRPGQRHLKSVAVDLQIGGVIRPGDIEAAGNVQAAGEIPGAAAAERQIVIRPRQNRLRRASGVGERAAGHVGRGRAAGQRRFHHDIAGAGDFTVAEDQIPRQGQGGSGGHAEDRRIARQRLRNRDRMRAVDRQIVIDDQSALRQFDGGDSGREPDGRMKRAGLPGITDRLAEGDHAVERVVRIGSGRNIAAIGLHIQRISANIESQQRLHPADRVAVTVAVLRRGVNRGGIAEPVMAVRIGGVERLGHGVIGRVDPVIAVLEVEVAVEFADKGAGIRRRTVRLDLVQPVRSLPVENIGGFDVDQRADRFV